MSENNDPQNDPSYEHTPTADLTQEPGWETLEYEHSSAGQPAGERTVVELSGKRRASPGHRARRAGGAPGEPAQPRRHGELSWIQAGAAAVLAACVGAAIALAITSPPKHVHTTASSTSAKRSSAPRQPPPRRARHHPQPQGRAKAPTTPTAARASSDSRMPALSQAPAAKSATSTAAGTASPPAPVRQADAEGQTTGGPFSP
ncbi:MAG: hypothetical protein ABR992_18285 [Solirubrobacteraceae bacterium]|jgi:hypothetical protein